MNSNKIGSIKTSHCPTCGALRNCKIEGHQRRHFSDDYLDFWSDYYLLVCQGCGAVFFQNEERNSETLKYTTDPSGHFYQEPSPTVTTWPAPPKRQVPEWFKCYYIDTDIYDTDLLSVTLREVYLAYNNDMFILTSIGIRTCFDIVSILLGVDSNLTFKNKLTKLVADGHILQKEKDNLEVLVDAGSASAHRGWIPDSQQVSILIDVLENFIVNAIIIPTKTKKDVAAIKNKIPRRSPRTRQP